MSRTSTPARLAGAALRPRRLARALLLVAPAALALPAARAQQSTPPARILTTADYARAERWMPYYTVPLVSGGVRNPTWLADGRLWYRTTTTAGTAFIAVDPRTRRRSRAFDQARLAAALSAAAGTTFAAESLPITSFDVTGNGRSIEFDLQTRRFSCDFQSNRCIASPAAGIGRDEVRSPDGRKAAFIRAWNLWVRDLATGRETQLTTDGVKDFGYATDNAGWTRSDRPILLWSPDSRKIATFQQDQRGDGEMYLVTTNVGHPHLEAWKYPLPGDSIVTMIQRVIIDVDTPRVVRLQMPPDQHRSTICDDVSCRGGEFTDVHWSPDGSRLFFVSTSRDHKHEVLREADASTGAVRDILSETSPTQYEGGFDKSNWSVLPASNEVIWFSERDDWGHLYLYDLRTGRELRRLTSGSWPVLQVLRVEPSTRTIFFTGAGREPGDPYFRHLYSIRMDGSDLRLLTPDSADHDVEISPDGQYVLDTYSTPQTPPTTVLRDRRGRLVMRLETTDISRLVAEGWKPPMSITVKARDGKTDLYGLLFRPTAFDSTRKYPIVDNIYPGPQTGSVGTRSFVPSRGDAQSLADLGFVVVQIDGMGTPMRSKSFHDAYYGDMGDNTLPDQVTGMKQLAQHYAWIDIDRAGIWGHSGGGFATADAMFRYPDFFKVGISESGNHDNREYEDDWGERYQGLLKDLGGGRTNYDDQANQNHARNLKGKLLLAHGTMDDNVPPYNTLLVVDALIRANKDFDLLLLPNQHHGYGVETNYMTRRRWDYFVRNLMGAVPPTEYEMHPPAMPGFRR